MDEKTQDILDCIKKPASKRYGAKGDFWLMEFWQIVCRRELPELKSSLSITEGEFHLSFDSYNELVIALTAISKAMRDVGDYAPTDKDLYQSLVDFQKAESICPKINVNKPELSYFEGVYSGQLISCEKNIFSNAISYRLNISNRIFYYDDDFDFRRSFSHCEDLVVGEPVTVSFTEDKKLGSVSRWIVQPSRVVLAPIQKYRLLELAKGVLKQAVIIFLLTAFIFLVDLPKYLLAAAISIDAIFSLWGLLLLVLLGIECVLWMKWGGRQSARLDLSLLGSEINDNEDRKSEALSFPTELALYHFRWLFTDI